MSDSTPKQPAKRSAQWSERYESWRRATLSQRSRCWRAPWTVDVRSPALVVAQAVHSIEEYTLALYETVHPTKPVEYFGREASAFTKRLVEGQQVYLDRGR